jgi:adenosylcobinamide-phosphate synthase
VGLALLLGLLLDIAYPEHHGILLKIHPVHTTFFCALRLSKPYGSKLHGLWVWLLCSSLNIAPFLVIILAIEVFVTGDLERILWIAFSALTLKFSLSPTLLLRTGLEVYRYSSEGLLDLARERAQGLVRRDLREEDVPHVLSATIESLAESFVDGILSPLFYFTFLGPLGAIFQRIVNTLDGALGFKTKELIDEGFVSAKADDIINYIPSRLSVVVMLACAALFRRDLRRAFRTWRLFSGVTESPNAGHPMSTIAGLLGVWLEKRRYYVINPRGRDPSPRDVYSAVKLVACSTVLSVLASLLACMILHSLQTGLRFC